MSGRPRKASTSSQKSKAKARRLSLPGENLVTNSPQQHSDDATSVTVRKLDGGKQMHPKIVLHKVKDFSSMNSLSGSNTRSLRSNTPRFMECVTIPISERTNGMPLLDESDLDDRFVKRIVRSTFKPLTAKLSQKEEITSGDDANTVADNVFNSDLTKITFPYTLKSEPSATMAESPQMQKIDEDQNAGGGHEDSLQIDAEDELIDFIEKEIMEEPTSPNITEPALAASSPKIQSVVVSSDEHIPDQSQSAKDFLDFLQSTSDEPCLTLEPSNHQEFPSFPTVQDHDVPAIIHHEPKTLNLLLPIINTESIMPISPIVDFNPKQSQTYLNIATVNNNSILQSNIEDINTPHSSSQCPILPPIPPPSPPMFDHHPPTALTYTVQSDLSTLIYHLLPGEYTSSLGNPTNVYTLGPPIESSQLEIINPECIPTSDNTNADDILQEAMRATFELDSRTDVVSMSLCSSPANNLAEDELTTTATSPPPPPPLPPGYKEKMCRKYNIQDSVVELTECILPEHGRMLRRRTKPTNYDENQYRSPSPKPETNTSNRHSNINCPKPKIKRGKTFYGSDNDDVDGDEIFILAETNKNHHRHHHHSPGGKSKHGKGKIHRKRKNSKIQPTAEQSSNESDTNKRIVLKMKRLTANGPKKENRLKRKRSAAYSSHDKWEVDLTTVEDPKALPDDDIIFNTEIEEDALKMANYIDGKEDSTLNQNNDKLLETPPKFKTTIRPPIELPASISLNNSLLNDIAQAPHTSTPVVARENSSLNNIPSIVSIENRFSKNSVNFFTARESNGVLKHPIKPFTKESLYVCIEGVLDLSKSTGRNFRPYTEPSRSQLHMDTNHLQRRAFNNQSIISKRFSNNIVLRPFEVNDLSVNRDLMFQHDRIIDLSVTSTTQTPYYSSYPNTMKPHINLVSTGSQTSPPFRNWELSSMQLSLETNEQFGMGRVLNNQEPVGVCTRKRMANQYQPDDTQWLAKRVRTEAELPIVPAAVETDEEIDIMTLDATDIFPSAMSINVTGDPPHSTVCAAVTEDSTHSIVPYTHSTATVEIHKETTKITAPNTIHSPSDKWKPSVYRHILIEPQKVQRQNLQVQFNNSPSSQHSKETHTVSNKDHHSMPCGEQLMSLPAPRPNIGSIAKSVTFNEPKPTVNANGPIVMFDKSSLNNTMQPLATDHNFSWPSFPTKADRSYDDDDNEDNSYDEDVISIFAPSLRSPSPELNGNTWFKKPIGDARNAINELSSNSSISVTPRFTDLRCRLNSKQHIPTPPLPMPSANSLSLKAPFKIPRLQNIIPAQAVLMPPAPVQPTFNVSGLNKKFTEYSDAVPQTRPNMLSPQMKAFFKFPCFLHMRNACKVINCKYSHTLPDQMETYTNLLGQTLEFALQAYNGFVTHSKKAFMHFFLIFCRRFADLGAIQNIIKMLADCEAFDTPFVAYYWHVTDSLERCGLSRVEAIKMVLANTKLRTTDALKELVEMMVRLDCLVFIDELSGLSSAMSGRFQHIHIRQLMDSTLSTKNQRMVKMMFDIIKATPDSNRILGGPRLEKFYFIVKECAATNGKGQF